MTNEKLKSFLRTAQTYVPFLQEARFCLQRLYRRARRVPFERDFRALDHFPDREGDVYVDAGANRGEAIEAMLMMRPRCRIEAFEPNPLLFRRLESLFDGDHRVRLDNVGLSDEEGEFTLYIPVYNGYTFDALASLDKTSGEEWLRDRLWKYDPHKLVVREERCRIVRLDQLSLNPYFIKLDIQGHELPALKGSEQTLARSQPILMVETPGEELRQFVSQLGYEPYAFQDNYLIRGQTGGLNTLFITDDRLTDNIARIVKA